LKISRGSLGGEISSTPSKSYTHRALVLGALSGSKFTVEKPLVSDDTAATLSAISMMGATITRGHDSIAIECEELAPPEGVINAWNSGTTIRLMSGVSALLNGSTTLTGDESLRRRPMKPLLDALRNLEAQCTGAGEEEFPPVTITGPMTGTATSLQGDVSSQFVSSLLLSCPLKESETEIEILGDQKSRPYVDITLYMLDKMGVDIVPIESGFQMPGNQRPKGERFEVPGDFSAACFSLAGAAITDGGDVTVTNIDPVPPQADSRIVETLEMFGAIVEVREDSVKCRAAERRPFKFDIGQSPDLFPILSVLAATADGESILFGGEHLRFKESDRISTTVAMLRDIGVDAEERDDGCVVRGNGRIKGGGVETRGDHRIMMASVIAGLACEDEITLHDDSSYAVSYPSFVEDIRSLGGSIKEVSD